MTLILLFIFFLLAVAFSTEGGKFFLGKAGIALMTGIGLLFGPGLIFLAIFGRLYH